jgi:hypothetical protein
MPSESQGGDRLHRAPEEAIDSEEKAREESDHEEGRGRELSAGKRSDATDFVEQSERRGDEAPPSSEEKD